MAPVHFFRFVGVWLVLVAPVTVLAAPASTSPLMEEIVVTAQKREERLQDTAVSVTAFTGEVIEKLGLRQSVDITAQTPNFSVGYPNGDTGIPALFIRGVGLNDFGVLNQGPVASYLDQSYIASNAGQIFQLLDVDRVEVLRGPQGTLYGRNATGGAVNFVSRKPTADWEGWGRAGYGSWESTKFEGAIGGPLTDDIGIRASILKIDSDGWMKNKLTGNDQNGTDELAWRVLLEADANESLNLLLNVHGGKSESDSVQYQHLGTTDPASVAVGGSDQCTTRQIASRQCVDFFGYTEQAPYTTPFTGFDVPAVRAYDEGNYDFEPKNDTKFWGTSLTATLMAGDLEITSITSYDDIDDSRPEETDASPNDLITGVLAVEQKTFSQELRVAQKFDSWDWLAGVFYMNDKADDHTSFDILRMLRPLFVGDDVNCSAGPGNPTGFCPEAFVFEQASATKQDITSFAVFADAHFDLTEQIGLAAGLRYSNEEIKQNVDFFFAEPDLGNPPIFTGKDKTDFDNVSGRAVLDYHPSDDLMFYGGVTTGFKAGGIQSTTDGIFPYKEEKLVSYEAGFKSTLADGRLRFNGAAFYYDYSDLQVFTFIIVGGTPFSILTNAADARVIGAEFELQALPVDNLFINLGLGILDTEYQDFNNPLGDQSGNKITLSPDLTFNGLVQYDVPMGDTGSVTFQLDFNYQDQVYFDSLNNSLLSEDAYWLWNGRIAWTSADEKWEAAAWGRNLGDEEYLVYAFDLSFLGFHERMLGSPRSFGIEFTYRH
jgi:iron complex outermembrane receptor protein